DRLMLDAAEALILEAGTGSTTLKEVGERAGYSRGLAHARFGSKEKLFLRLADRSRRAWVAEMLRAQGEAKGLSALSARFDAVAAYVDRHPAAARVMYILWFESVGSMSEMRNALRRFHEQARADIRSLIEEAAREGEIPRDVDAESFALQFCATFFGLCYQWLVNPDAVAVLPQVAAYKSQTLRALNATPPLA
ncbi:MAG: TetR family transcriptional regulator, partial [Myxococcota bacterium]